MRKARMTAASRRHNQDAPAGSDALAVAAKRLAEAERLRIDGKLDKARRICAGLITRDPDYSGAHHTMGLICADMHNYSPALSHLVRALMHNPDNWMTLTALSGVYLRLGADEMAARTLQQASKLKPNDAGLMVTLGEIQRGDRDYERGAEAFRRAIDLDQTLEAAKYGLGLCLLELGEFGEAAAVFDALVASGNTSITTLNAMSELPRELISSDILALTDNAVRTTDQTQAFFDMARGFTRAAALHNAGRHADAWSELVAANAAVAPSFEKDWSQQAAVQTAILKGARAANIKIAEAGTADDTPISLFVLGASRSGKTTAERLIGTLDGVRLGFENRIVENTVKQTFQNAGLPSRQQAIELPPGLSTPWQEAYLADLARRAGDARVFTNTNPGQIQNALRIASTIPSARFILVKRDAADTAFRIFMKKYQSGNPYAYDLAHIHAQLGWYHEMIDVLAEKAPGVVRVIACEEMIEDPRAILAAASDLCGLPRHSGDIPTIGDDRGCSAPYRDFMAATTSN